MEALEAFCGKWKTGPQPENVEEYAKALGLSADMIAILNKPHFYDITCSGDTVTSVTTIEGVEGTTTHVSRIGEKARLTMPPFGEYDSYVRMEGNVLVNEQDYGTFKQVMKVRMEGEMLVLTSEAKGVTMTSKVVRA